MWLVLFTFNIVHFTPVLQMGDHTFLGMEAQMGLEMEGRYMIDDLGGYVTLTDKVFHFNYRNQKRCLSGPVS